MEGVEDNKRDNSEDKLDDEQLPKLVVHGTCRLWGRMRLQSPMATSTTPDQVPNLRIVAAFHHISIVKYISII